jgi:hypothetical protein
MNRNLIRRPAAVAMALAAFLFAPGSAALARGGRPPVGTRTRVVAVVPIVPHGFYWGPEWSVGLGWGPYSGWYGPPYPPYGYVRTIPADWGGVELHVSPRKALVKVDGEGVGQARDYNSDYQPLWLKPGKHTLELSREGYETLKTRIDVAPGRYYDMHYRLQETRTGS